MRGGYCSKWCTVVCFLQFNWNALFCSTLNIGNFWSAEAVEFVISGCNLVRNLLRGLLLRWLCEVEIWTCECACPLSKLPSLVCGSTVVTGPESQQCHFHSHFVAHSQCHPIQICPFSNRFTTDQSQMSCLSISQWTCFDTYLWVSLSTHQSIHSRLWI